MSGDNGLWCVTNDVHGLPPCVVRGKHTDFCDGFEHRWVMDDSLSQLAPGPNDEWKQQKWTLELVGEDGKTLPRTPPRGKVKPKPARECTGCLPRKAEHGLLCWSCWEKTKAAMGMAVDMVTHLASVDRAQQIDGAGIRGASGWVLPVPATWRLADEMLVLLGHPEPGLPTDATVWEVEAIVERFFDAIDIYLWVATRAGAEAAVRFYLAMQGAMKQHPMAEYEHQVRNVRCPKCKHRSLLWKPPLEEEGEVKVVCSNPACGREMDQAAYDDIAKIEEAIQRQARVKAGGVPRPIPPAPSPDDDDVEAVCADDWKLRHGDLPPIWRKKRPVMEKCVDCGRLTDEGIYDRKPPRHRDDDEQHRGKGQSMPTDEAKNADLWSRDQFEEYYNKGDREWLDLGRFPIQCHEPACESDQTTHGCHGWKMTRAEYIADDVALYWNTREEVDEAIRHRDELLAARAAEVSA